MVHSSIWCLGGVLAAMTACSGSSNGSGSGSGGGGEPGRQAAITSFADLFGFGPSPFVQITTPEGCVAHDLDGDRVVDFFFASGVFVWAEPSGNYGTVQFLPNFGSTACAAGDFDRDGDIDIVRGGSSGGGRNRVLLNDGGRAFTEVPAGDWESAPTTLRDLVVLDVDDDGDLDLIAGFAAPTFGRARLYLYDADTRFVDASARLPFRTTSTLRLVAADLDNDADRDLLLVGPDSTAIWHNDGSGRFTDVTATVMPGGVGPGAHDGDLLDFDGDGDTDLVLALPTAIALFANDGRGAFSTAPAPVGLATNVRVADAEGDGDMDLAVVRLSDRGIGLYRNDGAGRFEDVTPQTSGLARAGVLRLHLWQDVDGNGLADVVASQFNSLPTLFMRARTVLDYVSLELRGSFPVQDLTGGDIDADGDVDLFTRTRLEAATADCEIYWNDGAARFTRSPTFQLPLASRHVAFADIDGDRVPELLTEQGWYTSGPPFLQRGSWPNGRLAQSDPLAVQADGDTEVEVMLAGEFGLALIDGLPTLPSERLLVTSAVRRVEAADVDVDGDVDLVVALASGLVALLINDGTGQFTDASDRLPRPEQPWFDVAVSDVNRDRAPDILVVTGHQQGTSVFPLLNAGQATAFTASAPLNVRAPYIDRITAADVDTDGDTDLVLSIHNQGLSQPGYRGLEVVFHDGVDRYLTESWSFTSRLFQIDAPVVADLDGDRDLDLAWAGRAESWSAAFGHVFVNQHRALQSAGSAYTGRNFLATLQEAPGYATVDRNALLLIGGASSGIRFPQLGTLFVSPPWIVVPIALARPAGRAHLVLPLPAGAIPRGFLLHTQAVFLDGAGSPNALSNPVVDVVFG